MDPSDRRRERLAAKRVATTVARISRSEGTAEDRLRRGISTMALGATLQNAVAQGIIPLYYLKGGMALELRFGLKARTSKDVDVGLQAEGEDLLVVFDRAISVGFDFFVFERKSARELRNGALRLQLRVRYRGQPWGTIDVDLAEAVEGTVTEEIVGLDLTRFSLPAAPPMRVLNIERQIAEKWHAFTAPAVDGKKPERARDIIDIVVCRRSLDLDLVRVRSACEKVFQERGTHEWPPGIAIPPDWGAPLEAHLRELDIGITAVEALDELRAILAEIVSGGDVTTRPGYEYRVQRLQLNTSGNVAADFRIEAPADIEALNNAASEGFKVIWSTVNPRVPDQLFVILERAIGFEALAAASQQVAEPFVNATIEHQQHGDDDWLRGKLKNHGPGPVVDAELRITGAGEVLIGSLADGEERDIAIRLTGQQLITQPGFVQFPALIIRYRTSQTGIREQVGALRVVNRDASGRQRFGFTGFDFPREVEGGTRI